MKTSLVKTLVAISTVTLLAISISTTKAQDAKITKLVNLKSLVIQSQTTPDIKAGNVKDKRWKPREWLEIEAPLVALPDPKKRDATFYNLLTFKYYLFFANPDKDKQKILTAEIQHTNIPIGEEAASVVYISPSTILNLTNKNRADASMITYWGVEVFDGSTLVGFASSNNKGPTDGGAWWKASTAPPQAPGLLLTKNQTPFAPLWGDYHLDTNAK